MLNLRIVIAPKCTSSPSVVLAPLVKREDVLALGKKNCSVLVGKIPVNPWV